MGPDKTYNIYEIALFIQLKQENIYVLYLKDLQ